MRDDFIIKISSCGYSFQRILNNNHESSKKLDDKFFFFFSEFNIRLFIKFFGQNILKLVLIPEGI